MSYLHHFRGNNVLISLVEVGNAQYNVLNTLNRTYEMSYLANIDQYARTEENC